tara:strand:+ start:4621 stop:5544 length:924 start_codon:yes stop_codon:yes gene_type:complete
MIKLIKLILLSLIAITPLAAIETYIELKVNDEIITNIDIDTEIRYLVALNNQLKNTDKKVLNKLAKESIIREKIKKNEIIKYYKLNIELEYLDAIVKNYYERLNIKNLDGFISYLDQYDLELDIVRSKIELEVLWNRLIGRKYRDQINVNEKILKQKIEKFVENNKSSNEYQLYEIIFQSTGEGDLDSKISLIQKDIYEQGFENAANIHSISDSSKFGGDIGWVDEKQLSKEILLGIKKLKVDEVSKPIKIANGFLILKIKNKKQKIVENDKKKLLQEAILFEENKQYNQFSIIYYSKIKLNSIISE